MGLCANFAECRWLNTQQQTPSASTTSVRMMMRMADTPCTTRTSTLNSSVARGAAPAAPGSGRRLVAAGGWYNITSWTGSEPVGSVNCPPACVGP